MKTKEGKETQSTNGDMDVFTRMHVNTFDLDTK